MKKLIFAILTISVLSGTVGESQIKVDQVVNAIDQQYKQQNIIFKIIPITDVPTEFFGINVPTLENGTIIQVKDVGLVWCSGSNINDTCYVVVKTKFGYNIEWWKKSSTRWYVWRTQRVGNVLPTYKSEEKNW